MQTGPTSIADRDVDAVVIATWPYLHAPVTLAALTRQARPTQARMAMDGARRGRCLPPPWTIPTS